MARKTKIFVAIGIIVVAIAIVEVLVISTSNFGDFVYTCMHSGDADNKFVVVTKQGEFAIYQLSKEERNSYFTLGAMPESPVQTKSVKLSDEDFQNIRRWAKELTNPNLENQDAFSTAWADYRIIVGKTILSFDAGVPPAQQENILATLNKYR